MFSEQKHFFIILLTSLAVLVFLSSCDEVYTDLDDESQYIVYDSTQQPANDVEEENTEADDAAARALAYEWFLFENAFFGGMVSIQHDFDLVKGWAEHWSERLGTTIAPEDIDAHIVFYDWLDYISEEQLAIVIDYLGIVEGEFNDNTIINYIFDNMSSALLRYYDSIPIENMPDDPRRIIIRMLEAWLLVGIEYAIRENPSAFAREASIRELRFSSEFGREIVDWRDENRHDIYDRVEQYAINDADDATAREAARALAYEWFLFENAFFGGMVSIQHDFDLVKGWAEHWSERLGTTIAPEDIDAHILFFDWLDYISEEQLAIVIDYLGIVEGEFSDWKIIDYIHDNMSSALIRHYDSIPIEDMPDDPRRILTRMFEAWFLVGIEDRIRYAEENPSAFAGDPSLRTLRFVSAFNRDIVDWR